MSEEIYTNFFVYTTIEGNLKNQDICFYCIGVYTGQVPTEEFKKIIVAYTEIFANTLKKNSEATNFCFFSGQGADSSAKNKVLFAREKGIAENILVKLKFASIHIFRSGYIYPDVKRVEPNFIYNLMHLLYKPIKFIYPNVGIASQKLAARMVDVGIYSGDKFFYENDDIRLA